MSQNLRDAAAENLSNMIFGRKPEVEKKTWELVKELEESHISDGEMKNRLSELTEVKATMLVNFGNLGRHTPGLCDDKQSASQMLVAILSHFVKPRE